MLTDLFVRVVGRDPVMQGLAGGVVIAVMNTLGAALVVVWRDPTERGLDAALGFAAGVMLSASFTSLLLPGIDAASAPGYRALSVGGVEFAGVLPVLVGFALGVVLLDRADQWVPHVHLVITGRGGGGRAMSAKTRRASNGRGLRERSLAERSEARPGRRGLSPGATEGSEDAVCPAVDEHRSEARSASG